MVSLHHVSLGYSPTLPLGFLPDIRVFDEFHHASLYSVSIFFFLLESLLSLQPFSTMSDTMQGGREGGGYIRAVTEVGFAHVTTKTWAYLGVFGFFRKKFD